MSKGAKIGIIVGIVVLLAILIGVLLWYYLPQSCEGNADCTRRDNQYCDTSGKCRTKCETNDDCDEGETCDTSTGVCGTSSVTAPITPAAAMMRRRMPHRRMHARRGRRAGFNSDEMNWPTAGSLVLGDTYPYGNYSGYDVLSFKDSYDPLY